MIEAKIIKDSISAESGVRLTTFELDYPRFIHAEIMTHRVFSRNAQSSRAVPVKSTLAVNQEWVTPIVWGKNKSGMSSEETLQGIELESAKQLWDEAAKNAFVFSDRLAGVNLHKQWANRPTEAFSNIKVVLTATEFDNFFWLRDDPDAAQPEIVALTRKMERLYDESVPNQLEVGEWHLPYVLTAETGNYGQIYLDSTGRKLTEEEAIKISASCCAQVSYRRLNDTYEKAIEIYEKLFSGPKPHLSPTEHQAKVIKHFDPDSDTAWPAGITHVDRNDSYWSGNLQGWVQYRQLLG